MENAVMNEVVETVVENAPELPAITLEDISKNNVVDAVKYLASTTIKNFKMIDSNEAGFREEIDGLSDNITDINTTISNLHDQIKTMKMGLGAGLVLGGVAVIGFGYSIIKKKNKTVVEEQPVVLKEEDTVNK